MIHDFRTLEAVHCLNMIWRLSKDLDLPELWPYERFKMPKNWKWSIKKYCIFVITSMHKNSKTTWTSILSYYLVLPFLLFQKAFEPIICRRDWSWIFMVGSSFFSGCNSWQIVHKSQILKNRFGTILNILFYTIPGSIETHYL